MRIAGFALAGLIIGGLTGYYGVPTSGFGERLGATLLLSMFGGVMSPVVSGQFDRTHD